MSTSAAHGAPHRALSEALRREIDAARTRVDALATQRQDIEVKLRAARESENAARKSLHALEAIGREAGALVSAVFAGETTIDSSNRLAGAELRDMIARVALQHRAVGQAVHWSEWYAWFQEAGFEAAGKNPSATFLTQLARSALVRRSTQDGVYILDLTQFVRERERLHTVHHRLAELPPPDQLALLSDVRAQRRALQNEIARAERSIEEMWRVLAQERPPILHGGGVLEPASTVAAWLESGGAARQED